MTDGHDHSHVDHHHDYNHGHYHDHNHDHNHNHNRDHDHDLYYEPLISSPEAAMPNVISNSSEQTPLLHSPQGPLEGPPQTTFPDKTFRYKVTLLCAVFIFIIDLSNFLMDPPSQSILEDVICYTHYPDHGLFPPGGGHHIPDKRCKDPEVQATMATLKSLTMIPEFLCPLLVQIPFGRLADLYGRRPVLRLSIIGTALSVTASTLVLALPQYLSVWLTIPSTLFLLLGGGTPMANAMVYTIMADVHPPGDRAGIFYLLMAFVLILSAVLTPVAAWLMESTPWLPMWIGFGTCWLGALSSFLLPETSAVILTKQSGDDDDDDDDEVQTSEDAATPLNNDGQQRVDAKPTQSLRSSVAHISNLLFSSRRLLALSLLTALHSPFLVGMLSYGLQYMTARYSYSWSGAAYVSSITRATAVVTLLVLLPLATRLLSSTVSADHFRRDLYLLRASALLLCAGVFLFGLAPSRPFIVASQVIYGLSTGFVAQSRCLVISLVDPHALATLNTALAVLEVVMAVVAAPILGWLLAKGLELGGGLEGLPYLVLGGVAGVAAMTAFLIRAPVHKTQTAQA